MGIELLEDVEARRVGRPTSERTEEIYHALLAAKSEGKRGLRVTLNDDEIDKFYRFSHRARSAATKAGVNVSVGRSADYGVANIRIKEQI